MLDVKLAATPPLLFPHRSFTFPQQLFQPMPTDPFFVAQGTSEIYFLPQMANRHGLIAGATGTGKTITLRTLAENFSAIGVPVFLADVKGDLAGLAKPGANSPKVKERAAQMGLEITPNGFPVVFWDVFGKSGHPVRATISDMGPLLLARLLGLNETQEGVLNVVFHEIGRAHV